MDTNVPQGILPLYGLDCTHWKDIVHTLWVCAHGFIMLNHDRKVHRHVHSLHWWWWWWCWGYYGGIPLELNIRGKCFAKCINFFRMQSFPTPLPKKSQTSANNFFYYTIPLKNLHAQGQKSIFPPQEMFTIVISWHHVLMYTGIL